MDSNGNNGNGDGSENSFVPWIDPEEFLFDPSERQQAFREVAIHAAEQGFYFKREWFALTKDHEEFKKNPMRLKEWREWCKTPAFVVWFYEEFPNTLEPDEHEMKMLDGEFWRGVRDGMKSNREWSFKLYAKVRWGEGNVNAAKNDAKDLDKFLGAETQSNKWHTTAEA